MEEQYRRIGLKPVFISFNVLPSVRQGKKLMAQIITGEFRDELPDRRCFCPEAVSSRLSRFY